MQPITSDTSRKTVLYLSYDGMLEPLGQSQVFGYLKRMSQDPDYHFILVSFEKCKDWEDKPRVNEIRALMTNANIEWIPLKYHKNPPHLATAIDILTCTMHAISLAFKRRIAIVHARSYIPAISALFLKRAFGIKFIFDMRGFWADERADSGQWTHTSLTYRCIKGLEKQFLLNADAVISLTHAGVKEMETFPYLKTHRPEFHVIPTCANLDEFKLFESRDTKSFWIGHIGSIGSWYLFDEALLFFKNLQKLRPDARLLILNRNEHEKIKKALMIHQITDESYELMSANHDEMAGYLSRLDAAVFFIKPFYSKKASAPTKLAELLGCGIPCVVNSGVGDMDLLFQDKSLGVCVADYREKTLLDAAKVLLELRQDQESSTRRRSHALRYFSAKQGSQDYLNVYRKVLLKSVHQKNAV